MLVRSLQNRGRAPGEAAVPGAEHLRARREDRGAVGQEFGPDAGWAANPRNPVPSYATTSRIFAGPDGTAQVRDCGDVARFGLPECKVGTKPDA